MIRLMTAAFATMSLLAGNATAQPSNATAQSTPSAPPNYAPASAWLCRPGTETLCTTGLDAIAIAGDGMRTPAPFTVAADPKVDCFYVYPTVSAETTLFADMNAGDAERHVVAAQAARLSSRCRVFAPIYRQLTSAGLRDAAVSNAPIEFDGPYRDVRAAWSWYLAHENHGRGVVLVGHSQGTIILQQLIAEEIDGKPVAKRLVAAFLAGDPGLAVPVGKVVGGVFKHVPVCTRAAETGCAYVWGSYLADDTPPQRFFGNAPGHGLVAACAVPAAPGGGDGELKAYLPRPSLAAASDPPWIELRGQLTGKCVADDRGNVLRVTVVPGAHSDLLGAALAHGVAPGWGLHRLDVSLLLGNIIDVLDTELAGWKG